MGWIEALASIGAYEVHISYAPDADLDSRFPAFSHDDQKMIYLNGWMLDIERLES